MTTAEMVEWFDILQDKSASVYFEDAEKLAFLNNAQREFVSQFFPKGEEGDNFEVDSNIEQRVGTLIFESNPLTMSAGGAITNATILTDLQTVSGDATCEIFKIGAVGIKKFGKRVPCTWMRHNDKDINDQNYFKRPTYNTPKYTFQNKGIQFRPTDTTAEVYVTTIKTPKILALSPAANSDLPIDTHNEIVAIALEFAGYASREEILAQIVKAAR